MTSVCSAEMRRTRPTLLSVPESESVSPSPLNHFPSVFSCFLPPSFLPLSHPSPLPPSLKYSSHLLFLPFFLPSLRSSHPPFLPSPVLCFSFFPPFLPLSFTSSFSLSSLPHIYSRFPSLSPAPPAKLLLPVLLHLSWTSLEKQEKE